MSGFIRRGKYALAAGMLSSPVWIPLQEAPGRRGVLTYTISRRLQSEVPALPFGWSAERSMHRNAWEVGPSWYILPRRWYRSLSWAFYCFAIEVGAAVEPYEGCYVNELQWWPPAPRMTARERWEAKHAAA